MVKMERIKLLEGAGFVFNPNEKSKTSNINVNLNNQYNENEEAADCALVEGSVHNEPECHEATAEDSLLGESKKNQAALQFHDVDDACHEITTLCVANNVAFVEGSAHIVPDDVNDAYNEIST
jgi:hypothetical protein